MSSSLNLHALLEVGIDAEQNIVLDGKLHDTYDDCLLQPSPLEIVIQKACERVGIPSTFKLNEINDRHDEIDKGVVNRRPPKMSFLHSSICSVWRSNGTSSRLLPSELSSIATW